MKFALRSLYALVDPRDEIPRYIGITWGSLDSRLSAHLSESRSVARNGAPMTDKQKWIVDLEAIGVHVSARLVARVRGYNSAAKEAECIRFMTSAGAPLLNVRVKKRHAPSVTRRRIALAPVSP